MTEQKISTIIADDNAISLDLLRGILANLGCVHIRRFRDGKAAVDAYKNEKCDIAFLDINMPVLSGIEALKQIREINPAAFVVIVSGESSVGNIQESLKFGAQGFVVKPYSGARIKEILDKYNQSVKT